MISLNQLKSLKQQADIYTVISHSIELKRNGVNFTGRCPFHDEKTQSFTVNKAKNIFKCFGCGKGGDVIDFIQLKHTGQGIGKAAEWLQNFLNILPDPEYQVNEYVEPPTSYINPEIYAKSQKHQSHNLAIWIKSIFPNAIIEHPISASKYLKGATIFWYLDIENRIRSGKVMAYNQLTGKRIKEPSSLITWVHKILKLPNFNMSTSLYGENLLSLYPDKSVCIVESEKTAIIASIVYPHYLWIASGSLSNLSYKRCLPLLGRHITLHPDVGAEDRWREKMEQLSELIKADWSICPIAGDRVKGYDLCDYILENEV